MSMIKYKRNKRNNQNKRNKRIIHWREETRKRDLYISF